MDHRECSVRGPGNRRDHRGRPDGRRRPLRTRGVLGTGASAVVRRASDRISGQTFAVKLFHVGASAHDRRRQQREMRALAMLHHPGLVALHDGGVEDGRPFIVTDLVEGPRWPSASRRARSTRTTRCASAPGWPTRWPTCIAAGSCTATSSRRTCCSARTAAAGRLRDRPRARRHRGDRHRIRRRHRRLSRARAGAGRVGRARGRRLRPRAGAARVADRAPGYPGALVDSATARLHRPPGIRTTCPSPSTRRCGR